MYLFRGIGAKIAAILAAIVGGGMILLTLYVSHVIARHHRADAEGNARRLVETLWRSTRSAMLDGVHDRIRRTISFVANEGAIQRIQVLDVHGVVRYSSDATDEGKTWDLHGPACGGCHRDGGRKVVGPAPWAFSERSGGRSNLGVVRPIRNRPECQTGGCHATEEGKPILGLLYVSVSMNEQLAGLAALRLRLLLWAGLCTLLVTAATFLLVRHLVSKPVGTLVDATRRLAAGDLQLRLEEHTRDEMGELARAFNDTTDKLASAHRQLLEAEKMASLGRLSAGVAHEINNPLTGILTFAEVIRDEAAEGRTCQDTDINAIIGETLRCRAIVQRLLDFARERPMTRRRADLNELVEAAISLLERQVSFRHVEIVRRLGRALPLVRLDPNQIHQVVVNLLINATDAMPGGGKITVTTEAVGKSLVALRVADTGVGIPKDVRTRLFDPFFTTKPKGTGLGLAVAWGIVQRHLGTLSFVSELNRGTTFTMELPVEAPEEKGAPAAPLH